MKVLNATMHAQNLDQFSKFGIEFVDNAHPMGFLVDPDHGFDRVQAEAKSVIAHALNNEAEALLLGGLTSATVALADEARKHGLGLIEAITLRTRDENGRFVFQMAGVRTIVPPQS